MSAESPASDPAHPTADTTHMINESADKIRLKAKLKRGSATRDQDTIVMVIKGDDPTETVARLDKVLAKLTDTADTARAIQPGGAQ